MTETFGYRLIARDGGARLGEIATPRGNIRTPAFMPVGTYGTVKAFRADRVQLASGEIFSEPDRPAPSAPTRARR